MNKKVLFSVLDKLALERKSAIAVEEDDRNISYADLKMKSDVIGDFLYKYGISKNSKVGVFLPNGVNHVVTFLGVSKAAGIFFPLDIDYPIQRFEYLINTVKPKYIITDNKHYKFFKEKLIELNLYQKYFNKVILLNQDSLQPYFLDGAKHSEEVRERQLTEEDDSMYLMNTSGSTGQPKIIEGMHKSVSHFLHWEVKEFGLNKETVGCVLARPSFDLNLREVFAPLLAGGKLLVPNNEVKGNPNKLARWIKDHEINLIHPIPSIFRLLMHEVKNDANCKHCLSELANVLFAGEALFGKDIHEWLKVGNKDAFLANLFGPSETTLAKIFYRIGTPDSYQSSEVIPLGKPLPNTVILLMDGQRLCNPGAVGEILIKTPFRSKGYFNNPDLTAEKFVQNPLHNDFEDIVYKTGDLGRLREDETLLFVGRIDSQVKVRGNRIELPEVEKSLLAYDSIDQVVVLAVKNSNNDNVLVCYYTGDKKIEELRVREFLKRSLPDYMFPSFYIRLEEFPLNINGKIDRKSLRSPEEMLYEQTSFEPPKTELEKKLAEIWSAVLDLKKVGVNNSFYELGGHSLSVAKVVTRVFGELAVDLSLRDVFKHSTIKKLASLISSMQVNTHVVEIEKAPDLESYELTYNQKSIWLASQTEESSLAFNIPSVFTLKGSINTEIFAKALNLLAKKHESLRTIIEIKDGEPRQRILDVDNFVFDLKLERDVEANSETNFIDEKLNNEANLPFNMNSQVLYRSSLTELNNNKWLFIITAHHIICDGWSREVLLNDLISLYKKLIQNEPLEVSKSSLQFKDYAFWCNKVLASNDESESYKYWINNYKDGWPRISLKKDFTEKTQKGWNGDNISFQVDPSLAVGIRNFGQQHSSSVFMIITAAIKVLMFKLTGVKDIVVGSPFAGRKYSQFEMIVGMFVTVLPLKTKFENTDSFLKILEKVKETVLDGHDHQGYPFEAVADELDFSAEKHKHIYDVIIQTQQFASKRDSLVNVEIVPYSIKMPSSKVDVTFDVSTDDEKIVLSIEYDIELFKEESICVLYGQLLEIINWMLKKPDTPMSEIKIKISEEEQEEENQFLNKMMGA
ncbi:MAG: amino acid adenylation domain-containing protein [Cyclobacteriaceae bacterium]|jgi:amino acid adenylation domain-containing protein